MLDVAILLFTLFVATYCSAPEEDKAKPVGGEGMSQSTKPPPRLDTVLEKAKSAIEGTVIGVICMACGGLMCFCGKRFFKVFLAMVGFLVGAIAGFYISALIPTQVMAGNEELVHWVIVCALGILGSVICLWMWKVGVYVSAGLGGYCLTTFILGLQAGGLIETAIGRTAALAIGIGLGVVLAYFLEEVAVVVASAMTGALVFTIGLDFFTETGFRYQVYNMAMTQTMVQIDELPTKIYWMYAGTLGLAVFGAVVQFINFPRAILRSDSPEKG